MSSQFKLDQQYADVMSNHPYGIALYRPIASSILKPGSVGYFDDNGDWNPICSVDSRDSLVNKGLSPVADALEMAPVDDGIRWGPKLSSNTKSTKIDLSGGIDPATGIPLTVSAVYSYSTDNDCGGVLLTTAPITHRHYYHTTPFKTWCKSNALAILRKWPEVKDKGIWIVTSTYTSKKCAINMWAQRGRAFKVGFAAEATGFGKISPNGEWHRNQTDEGWGEYERKGDDQSVVFFGGLKFQYTWVLGKDLKSADNRRLRGALEQPEAALGEIIATLPDPDDEACSIIVDCEEYLDESDGKTDQDEKSEA